MPAILRVPQRGSQERQTAAIARRIQEHVNARPGRDAGEDKRSKDERTVPHGKSQSQHRDGEHRKGTGEGQKFEGRHRTAQCDDEDRDQFDSDAFGQYFKATFAVPVEKFADTAKLADRLVKFPRADRPILHELRHPDMVAPNEELNRYQRDEQRESGWQSQVSP